MRKPSLWDTVTGYALAVFGPVPGGVDLTDEEFNEFMTAIKGHA